MSERIPIDAGDEASPPAWRDASDRPLRVLMLGNGQRSTVVAEADRLRPLILQHAEIVLTDFDRHVDLSRVAADFAIVLGGDGSILHAVKQLGFNQLPVLGVNLGKLGFLAAISPDEFLHIFPQVCAGECRIVNHLMLSMQRAARRCSHPPGFGAQ